MNDLLPEALAVRHDVDQTLGLPFNALDRAGWLNKLACLVDRAMREMLDASAAALADKEREASAWLDEQKAPMTAEDGRALTVIERCRAHVARLQAELDEAEKLADVALAERDALAASGTLLCAVCGSPATCIGSYESDEPTAPACDDCCAHGNEDGHCRPIGACE